MLRNKKPYGFSLIELLIVVAIIGVLSTIGIPTFRSMVQKAKKSEAKVALGGLATVESAFFSEYNSFGNRLDKVGFEIDGNTRLFATGFPAANCADVAAAPISTSTPGILINSAYPGYYATPPAIVTVVNRSGAKATDKCWIGGGTVGEPYSPTNVCPTVGIRADGAAYVAGASGAIFPGSNGTTAKIDCGGTFTAGSGDVTQSVWIIDSNKMLAEILESNKY